VFDPETENRPIKVNEYFDAVFESENTAYVEIPCNNKKNITAIEVRAGG
jgi:hypothetical protein